MDLKITGKIAATALLATQALAGGVAIPVVTVGLVGNDPDPTSGWGRVNVRYSIGVTEVTIEQYAAFLNAVAASDPNGLYNAEMAGPLCGIQRAGASGSYTYSVSPGRAKHPVNFVSFWDAARFANWLHNGQPVGPQSNATTEDGAYTLSVAGINANTIERNPLWRWAITSEDEWYKAAYYQPFVHGGDGDDYWKYPTSDNNISELFANFGDLVGNTTPVASYSANYFGTFDMAGNLWEWTERISNLSRSRRGSGFASNTILPPTISNTQIANNRRDFIGFRVVQNPFNIPSACPSDLTKDRVVDDADFQLFAVAYNLLDCNDGAMPPNCPGDLNGDGFVDDADFSLFAIAYDALVCP